MPGRPAKTVRTGPARKVRFVALRRRVSRGRWGPHLLRELGRETPAVVDRRTSRPQPEACTHRIRVAEGGRGGRRRRKGDKWDVVKEIRVVSLSEWACGRGSMGPGETVSASPQCHTDTRTLTQGSVRIDDQSPRAHTTGASGTQPGTPTYFRASKHGVGSSDFGVNIVTCTGTLF